MHSPFLFLDNLKEWIGKPEKEALHGLEYFLTKVDTLIKSFIDLRKPLIIAANGPGVGLGLTALGLVDYAICSQDAWFWAPFTRIGLSAEFCSSYTMPRIIGATRASQALLFSQKVTSQEALDWGLVSKVAPKSEFSNFVEESIHKKNGILNCGSLDSMIATKLLIRNDAQRDPLHRINEAELKTFGQRCMSPEAQAFGKKFLKM